MSSMQPIRIDGSLLEGGGQILRIAVALSAILSKPIHIDKIRAGRSKPGLAAQHLAGIKLVGQMCGANTNGLDVGSTELKFVPSHKIKQGTYRADPKTAGAITLILQVALPCAMFSDGPIDLHLRGGTNVDMAPQIDYLTEVFRPNLEKFSSQNIFDFSLNKRGYFPRGGGDVNVQIYPVPLIKPITLLDPGVPTSIYGWSYVAGDLPIRLADEMAREAKSVLKNASNLQLNIEVYKESREMAFDKANGIILVCATTTGCIFGGSGLGSRNISPTQTGSKAATEIIETLQAGACIDKYTQDGLIIYMALAEGVSSVRVTELTMHTKTAIYVTEALTQAKFEVIPDRKSFIIKCTGIGHCRETKN